MQYTSVYPFLQAGRQKYTQTYTDMDRHYHISSFQMKTSIILNALLLKQKPLTMYEQK